MTENQPELKALSPLDGRYAAKVASAAEYFCEHSYTKHRVEVEVEYLLFLLCLKPPLKNLEEFQPLFVNASVYGNDLKKRVQSIYVDYTLEDTAWIKQTEFRGGAPGGPIHATNHDVKSVEYFVKYKLLQKAPELRSAVEFIHFGLTSQDISNTSMPLMTKRFILREYYPRLVEVITALDSKAREWQDIPMLARTHGQPASPTRVGKEIMVFVSRLKNQVAMLDAIPHSAKFGGATGNFNSHFAAFPKHNWIDLANDFVHSRLGLERYEFTTQVENYDNAAAIFHNVIRLNVILLDFCRDMWLYVANNLFKQKLKKGEIGSSAMPHKVNPIDFENAEGNLGLANSLFAHLAEKLPISRMQRDLTDSTVTRNIGVPFGYTLVALSSILKGIGKLEIQKEALNEELEQHWEVVAEGIQTILRREKVNGAYELLKDAVRGKIVTKEDIQSFISKLEVQVDIDKETLGELRALTPQNYVGMYNPGETLHSFFKRKLKPESFNIIEKSLS